MTFAVVLGVLCFWAAFLVMFLLAMHRFDEWSQQRPVTP